ncbi:glyoxalase [Mycolicibacterium sp. CH28]|uniref:VOC family protein n=1 Tax=Mycolicibacterium sp. CH28 TaxID=2512237 RepID=UPI0010820F41|nr:VOC family protein [Mycolicibacterium sp. CH28]TGD87531.1 glyoxalase [Mycolicibacterium sp. CH28]
MLPISGFDHVAITVADLDDACAFYAAVFGAQVILEHAVDGDAVLRQVTLGHAVLSIHQYGNGVHPAAAHPTVGAADICLRCTLSVATLLDKLDSLGVEVVEGPAARRTADGEPSQSVYFRDPDGNLLEMMVTE